MNLLADWQSGFRFTWTGGGGIPGIVNNVQWRDYRNVDLRLSKSVKAFAANIQLFMDVNNVFNIKAMTASPSNVGYGFFDTNDYNDYMKSLHLPPEIADLLSYGNVPGNDRPGMFRKDGVAFVPIGYVNDAAALPKTPPRLETGRRLLYYVRATGEYMEFQNGALSKADAAFVNQVLKDKAYIDMPNQGFLTFLNPRDIFFGVNISFDVKPF